MSNLIILRPQNLFYLFKSLDRLNGIGEKKFKLLEKKIGPNIINLLCYLPIKSINRFENTSLKIIDNGKIITTEVEVSEVNIPSYSNKTSNNISRIITFGINEEDNIRLDIIYFVKKTQFLKNLFKVGEKIIVSGKFESFNGLGQIVHPDYITNIEKKNIIPEIETIYPLFLGVNQKFVSKIVFEALKDLPIIQEWLSEETVKKLNLPSWKDSIKQIHNPKNIYDTQIDSIYRRRLALDELIANQISMLLIKQKILKKNPSKIKTINYNLVQQFLETLPFQLTDDQKHVVKEITHDIKSNQTMIRMLQGDVGSGKTIVALIAMITGICDGSQSVLLVPTEVLAIQHFNTIANLLKPLNIKPILLLGESKSSHGKLEKLEMLKNISNGTYKIIIGTHALISKKVNFKKLSLAIIDEQQRFGVKQRVEITEKGENVNVLVMTATPIPRSLALTAYGDMDISTLKEKPKGRLPIKTYVLPQQKIDEVLKSINRAIQNNALVYWVCPLIEESENSDLIAVIDRFNYLKSYFKNFNISLVHGKQKSIERESAINDFKEGKSKILVATTVIEVGVDIPNATIIIIECAERFGLAQIHQLRGRVGRSDKESSCILLYGSQLSPTSHSRLKTIKNTNDGFKISESDLILRGAGEVLGSKQSGNINFKFVDLHYHNDLISIAREEAKKLLTEDNKNQKINTLLSIFENNEAVRLLKGG